MYRMSSLLKWYYVRKPYCLYCNPSFEPENEETLTTAETKKNVLVIGGGPAGMEAAFVAAKRGHHVILADKQDALGGTVRIAAVPIAKQDLTQLIKYQAHKLEQVGVEVS